MSMKDFHQYPYGFGLWADNWPQIPKDIPEPIHDGIFGEKFPSVYVVKGVWSLHTALFLNRW